MRAMQIFISFLIFIPLVSHAQEKETEQKAPPVEESQTNLISWSIGVQFGSLSINGVNYNAIRFQPDISIWKFGIGLDLNFEFTADGYFRKTEWDSWQAVISKILYLRFGFKKEPIYVKIGGINDFIFGDGFIVNRYSNMLNYPAVKKLGFCLDLDFNFAGFESMADNVFDWDILGLRGYARPLITTDMPIFSKLEIGATVAADLDPKNPHPSADKPYDFTDSTNSTNSVFIYGADISLPLVEASIFNMKTYADFAGIANKGTGEAIGISGNIGPAEIIFPYRLELRVFQPKFAPSYFNTYYDAERAYKYESLDFLTNNYIGWLFSSGINLFENKIVWLIQLEGAFSGDSKPSMIMTFSLTKDLFKMIAFKFTWMRQNIKDFNDIFYLETANSIFLLDVDFFASDNLVIALNYKRTFEVDSSGEIHPFSSTSISTKILF